MTSAPTLAPDRVFLVVADDSAELEVALRYACRRARKTRGRVALLAVVEPGNADSVLEVCSRWGLEANVIGEVTKSGRLEVAAGESVALIGAPGVAATLTWDPSGPLADGTYYWRVKALRANGTPGGWSAVGSFVVEQ